MPQISFRKVSIAAVSAFFVGFLIHGPVAGGLWMKLAHIHPAGNENIKDILPQILLNLLIQFVTAFALVVIYSFASASAFINGKGIFGGVLIAIWLWFGFLVTSSSVDTIWMGKDYKLWLFEVVSSLLVMVTMGAIIARGQKINTSN